jgi:hypothetical protein
MKDMFSEKLLDWAGFVIAFMAFASFVIVSPGSFQSGDTHLHYLIARYAGFEPRLFLDHWGKPVYTLLYFLPSQFGYAGAKVFTVFLGVSAVFLTGSVAKMLGVKKPRWSAIALLFSPIFFIHLNTAMTEVLFAFWLVAGIWLWLRNRLIVGAVWLSFLPFVRTEGFILVPLLSLWLIPLKAWKAFFLLGLGTALYSVVGSIFYYHDLLWVFHQNPYAADSQIYGSGPWNHFLISYKITWGIPLVLSLGLGLVFLPKDLFQSRFSQDLKRSFWLLIIAPFLVFLVFHSWAWWAGKVASNGEIRVLACTMPMAVIIANYGVQYLSSLVKWKWAAESVYLATLSLIVITPLSLFPIPFERSKGQEVIKQATDEIQSNYAGRKIWFTDPQVPVELGLNPFDHAATQQWFPDAVRPEEGMSNGDIVVWDAHFSPLEGHTPVESFSANHNFRLIRKYEPVKPLLLFDRLYYEVDLFECVK